MNTKIKMDNIFCINKNGLMILGNKSSGAWVKINEKDYADLEKAGTLNETLYKYLCVSHSSERINSFYILVTKRCNMDCEFCSQSASKYTAIDNDFKYEMLEEAIDIIKNLNPKKIIISGGEPFVRKDIVDILKLIGSVFGRDKVMIETNGLLLSPQIVKEISPYVSTIEISLENIVENEKLQRKYQSIFNEIAKNNILLNLSFVISSYNMKALGTALKFCLEHKAYLIVRYLAPIGRANQLSKDAFLSIKQINQTCITIIDFILEHHLDNTNYANSILPSFSVKNVCSAGAGKTTSMYPNGDLFLCANLNDENHVYANIFKDSYDELLLKWNNKLNNIEIQKKLLVDYDTRCFECDYKYFCTGICPAKKTQINEIDFEEYLNAECEFRKEFIEYYLFEYSKNDSILIKLEKLKSFLESK